MAKHLASGPTVAMALTRKAYWKAFENTYEQHLNLEAELLEELSRTEDWKEGFSAFSEKRKPKFDGR